MERLERHVSVIFSADIIGYTTMMQEDERDALEKIHHFEQCIKLYTDKFGGEIIKTYGDGCLVLFTSAVNAVYCAIRIQKSLQKSPVVPLRIGIHIGEIVRKDQDIFGSGINIASRIESMGEANSVLISSDVYAQIKNHPNLETASLGPFQFKNVTESVVLYAVKNDGLTVPNPKEMKGKGSSTKLVPWQNGWLSKIVAAIIIMMAIVIAIIKITGKDSAPDPLTSNLDALDYFLKGEFHLKQETNQDIDSAIIYFTKAIEEDPQFALAYSNLASSFMRKHLSFDPNIKWEQQAYSAAGQAVAIDPDLANPYLIRGQFFWSPSHDFAHEEAIGEFKKAIDRDPNLSQAYEQLALVQLHIGLFEDAVKNATKSLELEPGNFRARRFVAEALLFQGNYQASLKDFEKIPSKFAPLPTLSFKALNLLYLDKAETAIELINTKLSENPENPNLNSVNAVILAYQGKASEAKQSMQLAVENSRDFIHAHHVYYNLGLAAALMNQKETALEWLVKAADTGFPNYPLYLSDPMLTNLKSSPEYQQFLDSLKEKWEYYHTI